MGLAFRQEHNWSAARDVDCGYLFLRLNITNTERELRRYWRSEDAPPTQDSLEAFNCPKFVAAGSKKLVLKRGVIIDIYYYLVLLSYFPPPLTFLTSNTSQKHDWTNDFCVL